MTERACSKCKKSFPRTSEYFLRQASNPDGLRYLCKPCERVRQAANRERNRAKNRITPGSGNVFEDLGLPDAESLMAASRAAAPIGALPATEELPDFEITVDEPLSVVNEERPQTKAGPSPLEAAYLAHDTEKSKRDVKREHAALIEENRHLQSVLAEVAKLREPPPLTVITKSRDHLGDAVPCLVASDWHVEEQVEPHSVHGLNVYNLEVAQKRAEAFFRNGLKLIEIAARDSGVKRVWLGFLGDFFTNYLHDENVQTNLLAPGDAANFARGLLVSGVEFLLRESPYTLDIDAIPGNHGRMTKKMQIQNATGTSLETFMYSAIADRFHNNPRVCMRVAQSKMLYRNYFESFRMRLLHGDDVKFGGGVGGITIPIRKKIAAWDKAQRADLTVMGHFHQRFDGGDFIVNGSLIGFNEFAQAIGASAEEPQQAFFLVHARNGGQKSIVAPIWLDDKHLGGSK